MKNKTLDFKDPMPGSYTVKGDRKKLTSALRRLVENAVKYTLEGNIAITLEKKHGSLLISIEDTGIGISKDYIPRLFNEFARAKNARALTAVGSGLGLYIAKQIIEAHHGKVWVESAGISKGSNFFVQLPL